jgi:hypothetical protein
MIKAHFQVQKGEHLHVGDLAILIVVDLDMSKSAHGLVLEYFVIENQGNSLDVDDLDRALDVVGAKCE